ncbi:MAG: Rdx family protein [Deltaproteobacteria bacterium]|nr:Rdx family protein [Deltaproteobacteria bacterium]
MRDELNIEAKLIPGKRGIFDVVADGKTVFSKSNTSRFPSPGEVVNTIKPSQ